MPGAAREKKLVEGEDFYREGPYVVFTERYHLRRGYCCESGCRHCPFGPEGERISVENKATTDGETA